MPTKRILKATQEEPPRLKKSNWLRLMIKSTDLNALILLPPIKNFRVLDYLEEIQLM